MMSIAERLGHLELCLNISPAVKLCIFSVTSSIIFVLDLYI